MKVVDFTASTAGAEIAVQAAVFELTSDSTHRTLRKASFGSSVAAIVAHLAGLTVVIAIPVARVVRVEPERATIQAFVVTRDLLPPPAASPPPPAPAPAPRSEPASFTERPAAPIEAPIEIGPEPASPPLEAAGVDGGVEGGIIGGVVGGVTGGLGSMAAAIAPAPERPPDRTAAPLRISGGIKPPDLLHRVDPVYSPIAAASRISGVVILEAVVDVDGSVQSVKTLRSSNPVLDKAATDALKQWKYAPLVLAGMPTPFVVQATFKFRVPGVTASTGTFD